MRKTPPIRGVDRFCAEPFHLPAWAAEVVSSNIVGYEKITLNAGYNMIGVQFNQVGGEAIKLATFGTLDSSMAGLDEDYNYTTTLLRWNGNGYDTFGWTGDSGTEMLDDASYDYQWLNLDLEDEGDSTTPGFSGWVKAGSAGTLTVSGEVPDVKDITPVALTSGFNMLAYPFPKQQPLAKFATFSRTDGVTAGLDEDYNYTTTLLIWNGNGYNTFGWTGDSGTEMLDDASFDNQWLNLDLEDEGTTLDFGKGFWIRAAAAGTLTFN